ncbi:hypothetical protein [Paraprevotella clara]|uniref:Uncharacterized protein n=1 Tax=Paraprevotella clara YIT 11840 TaxID=762968 RepID=G5SSA3_9BACT|nr:hypothetical protein [Paraprevotella clara]EHG99821.1 hypothetical protein HMPREF9441_02253 [Paraprevotella clara YIT 11840]
MNTEKLKVLFEKSDDKYADSQKIGTTYQTMYNIIYKGSICKVDLLQKIASFYKVPVGYFFDEESISSNEDITNELNIAYQEINKLKKEIELLRLGKRGSTKVVVELDVDDDEFIKMGLKDKVIQVLSK